MQLPFTTLVYFKKKNLRKAIHYIQLPIKPVVKYGTNTSVYNNIPTVQRIRSQRDVGNFILTFRHLMSTIVDVPNR